MHFIIIPMAKESDSLTCIFLNIGSRMSPKKKFLGSMVRVDCSPQGLYHELTHRLYTM